MLLRLLSKAILPASPRNIVLSSGGCVLGATLLRAAIDPVLPVGVPYFTYWLAVDAAAIIAGWQAGALTIVVSALVGWWIFLPPRFGFDTSMQSLAVVIAFVTLAAVQMTLAAMMRTAVLRMEQANRDRELLVRELTHRLKNQLAVFQSIATSTLRHSMDTDDAATKLIGRIHAVSAALDVAVDHADTISLEELISAVVRPLAPDVARLQLKGDRLDVPAEQAQAFALMLHELATNALKYGAWQGPTGGVTVSWQSTPERLTLVWVEEGQQKSSADAQKGFGSLLIERAIDGAVVELAILDTKRIVKVNAPRSRSEPTHVELER